MKRLLSILLFGSLLAACGNGGNNAAKLEDEVAKAKMRMMDSLKTVDSLKSIAAKEQKTADSLKAVAAAASKHHSGSSNVSPRYADAEGTGSAAPAAAPKKKGMSSTAKGAIIGAGVGAVTGAIVDKKHGEGAIVGAVLGAGAGAGTGAIIDHNKKKKAQANQ